MLGQQTPPETRGNTRETRPGSHPVAPTPSFIAWLRTLKVGHSIVEGSRGAPTLPCPSPSRRTEPEHQSVTRDTPVASCTSLGSTYFLGETVTREETANWTSVLAKCESLSRNFSSEALRPQPVSPDGRWNSPIPFARRSKSAGKYHSIVPDRR